MRERRQTARMLCSALVQGLALVLCLANLGCRLPSTQPRICRHCTNSIGRSKVVISQVIQDTAQQTLTHPFRSTGQFIRGTVRNTCTMTYDVIGKRVVIPLLSSPPPLQHDRPKLCRQQLEKALQKKRTGKLHPAHLQLIFDGGASLQKLEALIDSAQRNINVLMYLWDSDAIGWSLARRLARQAKIMAKGCSDAITVRVVVDGGGNLFHSAPGNKADSAVNGVVVWLSNQPHVRVIRGRNAFAQFDHRKLVLVDEQIAWSGGRNFTLSSFFEYRDLSYTVRGPILAELRATFARAWKRSGGKSLPKISTCDCTEEPVQANASARLIGTDPPIRDFKAALLTAVNHARHHIYLENPYLINGELIYRLIQARRRGVDVRVILSENAQSSLIDRAAKPIINRLRRAGIRVFIYPGSTHAKAASVDGRWAYIGTGNFDSLSMNRNYEVGLSISSGAVIQQLEQSLFQQDMRPEWEVIHPVSTNILDHFSEMMACLLL